MGRNKKKDKFDYTLSIRCREEDKEELYFILKQVRKAYYEGYSEFTVKLRSDFDTMLYGRLEWKNC